ncbi:DUF2790 domain-containing protein [Pseudomonas sp. RC10]|uniref:DUF2790 domain-containing protein n=1 Tax=Pseudomonas bambusae TaxID=3139142 RepID=UPI00313A3EAD
MRTAFLLALLPIATLALADTSSHSSTTTSVEQSASPLEEDYNYSTHLDIAKVRDVDDVSAICSITPVKMTYDDSQGKTHILRYMMMGGGCNSGN